MCIIEPEKHIFMRMKGAYRYEWWCERFAEHDFGLQIRVTELLDYVIKKTHFIFTFVLFLCTQTYGDNKMKQYLKCLHYLKCQFTFITLGFESFWKVYKDYIEVYTLFRIWHLDNCSFVLRTLAFPYNPQHPYFWFGFGSFNMYCCISKRNCSYDRTLSVS